MGMLDVLKTIAMTDWRTNIWIDTVSEALQPFGVTLTNEQLLAVAESCEITRENWSMCDGSEHIPNPLLAEMDKMKREHNRELSEVQREKQIYKDTLCRVKHAEPSRVYIDSLGQVMEDCR